MKWWSRVFRKKPSKRDREVQAAAQEAKQVRDRIERLAARSAQADRALRDL